MHYCIYILYNICIKRDFDAATVNSLCCAVDGATSSSDAVGISIAVGCLPYTVMQYVLSTFYYYIMFIAIALCIIHNYSVTHAFFVQRIAISMWCEENFKFFLLLRIIAFNCGSGYGRL